MGVGFVLPPFLAMTIEEALEEFQRVLGKEGWGLQIYCYPHYPGSKFDNFSGEPKFHSYKYHLNASLSISSATDGIFHKNDDLVKGIMSIVNFVDADFGFPDIGFGIGDRYNVPEEPPEYPK